MPEERMFVSKRLFDPQANPPQFVDEELPTISVKLRGALRRARTRSPRGTIPGSIRLTGSFYQTARGSNSLRITRVSVFSGSSGNAWMIRHSRQGTVDVLDFDVPGQQIILGGPDRPVYALGPGTISWGFIGNASATIGSAYDMSQTMEGFLG